MNIIGIDPSLTNTAVVAGDTFDDFRIETFSSVANGTDAKSRIERFEDLAIRVNFFCDRWRHRRQVVFIEGYSFGSKGSAVTGICEYGGLLRRCLLSFTKEIYEVAPPTLKKFCTGKGSGPKDMIAAHLTKRYGVLLANNDEYDAFGLYQFGLVAMGVTEPANVAQREAVETVMNPKPKKPKPKRKRG